MEIMNGAQSALLAIIIVNFRTPDRTADCIRSLAIEVAANPGTRVVAVDNGSGDDSIFQLQELIDTLGWRRWCGLIVSERNRGFAGGINLGVRAVLNDGGATYFLFLNSDSIVQPGCLAHCLDVMERNTAIGVMSCRVINADGTVQNVCRRFPTPLRCLVGALSLPWRFPSLFLWADCEDPGWDRNTVSRDVDWVGGAFMLVRGDWIARYQALDEQFFFYGEDIEFGHRIHRTHFRCHYDPGATVVHIGGASSDPSRFPPTSRDYHKWRGRYLVQKICYGEPAKVFLQCLDFITVVRRIVWGYLTGRKGTAQYATMVVVLRLLLRNWRKWSEPYT